MSLSVAVAVLAPTAQRPASLQSPDPACLVRKQDREFSYLCVTHATWYESKQFKYFAPGYYCLEGSQTAAPISSVSGSVCPAGHFCAEGSSVPSPCPAGSYQNETGGKGEDDCKPCPLGKHEAGLCMKLYFFLHDIFFWRCPHCWNVARLVPGFIRPESLWSMSSRVPLPIHESEPQQGELHWTLQPSALPCWLHLSHGETRESASPLPQRHIQP